MIIIFPWGHASRAQTEGKALGFADESQLMRMTDVPLTTLAYTVAAAAATTTTHPPFAPCFIALSKRHLLRLQLKLDALLSRTAPYERGGSNWPKPCQTLETLVPTGGEIHAAGASI